MRAALKRALHILQVAPGEERLVALLLLHSFCIGISVIFFETVAYSIFLTRYEGASAILPVVYIMASTITIFVGFIYARIERWLSFRQLLTVNLVTVLLALLLFRLLFEVTSSPWPALIAVVGFDVLWVLQSLEFWGLAGRVFNVRQGKRLFGLVGSGEMLAMVIGGALVPLLVRFLPTLNLYFLSISGVLLSLLMMFIITRRYVTTPATVSDVVEPERSRAEDRTPRTLLRDRYIWLIFGLAALTIFTLYFTDNAFYDTAERRYPNPDDLAGFLGFFLAVAGFTQLFVRAILSGWILSRFGVMVGLLVLPVALALMAALALAANQIGLEFALIFWLVILVKLFDRSLRYSLNRAAQLVLYQPLTPKERVWAQTAAESIVEPIAGILSGVALLVLNQVLHFGTMQLLFALMVMIVFWIGVVVILNREYTTTLVRALNRRRLGGATISFRDNSSIMILRRTLASERPGEVIYALNMLESINHPMFDQFLLELAYHPADDVRAAMLRACRRRANPIFIDLLRERLLLEKVPALRSEILNVLSALGEAEVVLPYLDDSDPRVQLGALAGLVARQHPTALTRLRLYAESPLPLERALAAEVVGEVGTALGDEAVLLLTAHLHDETAEVRRAATIAAGKIKQPALYAHIISNLETNHSGLNAAITTLSTAGSDVLPLLEVAFLKPEQPRQVLIRLLRIMSKIKGDDVMAWLWQHIAYSDEYVRYYVLEALHACHFRAPPEYMAVLHQRILSEVKEAAWNMAAALDMEADERAALMLRALQQEYHLTRERILLMLSFMYDPGSLQTVRANYTAASKEKRAYAVEILDTLLPNELKPAVLPLMEGISYQRQLQALADLFPQQRMTTVPRLRAIIVGEYAEVHPWTKACAFYTIAELGKKEVSPDVAAVLFGTTDAIVRETALWSLYRLNPVLYNLYNRSIEDMKTNSGKSSLAKSTIVTAAGIEKEIRGQGRMLLMIEKVIILRTVSIFAEMPEDALAEIAMVLQEVEAVPETTFIKKGDPGNCLYIIASGQVRVHEGERTLAVLGEREVVGELALLDSEPRTADVTTTAQTMLLKLDQDAFFELITNNPEVVRGVMRVLTRRLRKAIAG